MVPLMGVYKYAKFHCNITLLSKIMEGGGEGGRNPLPIPTNLKKAHPE